MDQWIDFIVRIGLETTLTLAFGVAFFLSTYVEELRNHLCFSVVRRFYSVNCLLAVVLSVVHIIFLTKMMGDFPYRDVSLKNIVFFLSQGDYKVLFFLRFLALISALCVSLQLIASKTSWFACAILSCLAVITQVWFGHAASDDDFGLGKTHLIVDIVHILAAGVWGGSLLVFCWLLWTVKDLDLLAHILKRFSRIGYGVVTTLLCTGVVNTYFLVGAAWQSYRHPNAYVALILCKVLIFGLMIVLATLNHFVFVPYLKKHLTHHVKSLSAKRYLQVSIGAEYGFYLVMMMVVALVGGQSFSPDM